MGLVDIIVRQQYRIVILQRLGRGPPDADASRPLFCDTSRLTLGDGDVQYPITQIEYITQPARSPAGRRSSLSVGTCRHTPSEQIGPP